MTLTLPRAQVYRGGGGGGGGSVGWRPTRAEILTRLQGDIAMTDFEGQDTEWGTWEALWWDDAKFAAFADRYRAAGLSLVPCNAVVTNYRGVTFDFSNDPTLLRERLERCYIRGLIPMLCLQMVDAIGQGAETLARLTRLLPEIHEHVVCAFTAWELQVTGGPSQYTYDEHLEVIALADRFVPGVVLGVEFGTPENHEIITYDGRGHEHGQARDYWTRTGASRLDVLLAEVGRDFLDDPHFVTEDVGGAVSRFQGLFPIPDEWPEGGLISEAVKGNWKTDYGIHKTVCLFEYAAFARWSSERKRALRQYVQQVIPTLAGYGEG